MFCLHAVNIFASLIILTHLNYSTTNCSQIFNCFKINFGRHCSRQRSYVWKSRSLDSVQWCSLEVAPSTEVSWMPPLLAKPEVSLGQWDERRTSGHCFPGLESSPSFVVTFSFLSSGHQSVLKET